MAKAFRTDSGTLRAPREVSDGTILVDAVITRAGVFKYRHQDGSIQSEYRSPKEVFNPASMASFEHMAVTYHHPSQGLVTVDNRSEIGKGTVVPGSVRRDGMELIATLHVTDKRLIEAMRGGMRAVSCGYEQDLVKQPGTSPDGERFDCEQTNIEGNHVAIVDVARAGDVARARMDSATMMITTENIGMFKTLEEATEAYKAEKARADAAAVAQTESKKRCDSLEAERDGFKDKAEKAEKLRVDAAATAKAEARARITLEATAEKVLRTDGAEAPKFEGKSDKEIKLSVIEKLTGKKVASDKSEDYVNARYDAAMEAEGMAEAAITDIRGAALEAGEIRQDTGTSDAEKARQDMINRTNNAWKNLDSKKGN